MGYVLLGIIVLGLIATIVAAVMNSKTEPQTWPIFQAVLLVFVFLAAIGFFYLGARTLAVHKNWRDQYNRSVAQISTLEAQLLPLVGGTSPQGQGIPGEIPRLKHELSLAVNARAGGVYYDVKAEGIDGGVVTLTITRPAAKPASAEGEDAAAPFEEEAVPEDAAPEDALPEDAAPADEMPADEVPDDPNAADPNAEMPADEVPAEEVPVDDETPADAPADDTAGIRAAEDVPQTLTRLQDAGMPEDETIPADDAAPADAVPLEEPTEEAPDAAAPSEPSAPLQAGKGGHGLVLDTVLFAFDQTSAEKGGRYLGEFRVVEASPDSPTFKVAPNLPLTADQLARLEAAAAGGTWTLYTAMPVDSGAVFAQMDAAKRQKMLPAGAAEEYAKPERPLRDFYAYFHENHVQRVQLADAISKTTSNIQRTEAATREAEKESAFRQTEIASLQSDLQNFQAEVKAIAAYDQTLDSLLGQIREQMKATYLENRRAAALLTQEKLKAAEEIDRQSVAAGR